MMAAAGMHTVILRPAGYIADLWHHWSLKSGSHKFNRTQLADVLDFGFGPRVNGDVASSGMVDLRDSNLRGEAAISGLA